MGADFIDQPIVFVLINIINQSCYLFYSWVVLRIYCELKLSIDFRKESSPKEEFSLGCLVNLRFGLRELLQGSYFSCLLITAQPY